MKCLGTVEHITNSDSRPDPKPTIEAQVSLLDALPTALLLADAAGRVLYANSRAERILGPVRGERIGDVLAPEALGEETAGEGASGRRVARRRPGLVVGYSVSQVESQPADGPRYAIVFQDIGPLERLREERDRLLRLAAVGETLPAVLHEIKNPLAGITTAVEVLLEEVGEGPVRRELNAVLSEVRRITLVLEGVGLFRSELHTGRPAAIDLALREAFLVIEPQIKNKGLTGVLTVDSMPPLPLDAGVVRALFFNLVTNAIHACEPGAEIAIAGGLRDGGRELELSVADTGSGMSPEVLARCRELFFTTKPNGSGIGLALCATVLERAGGLMRIESAPGRGTRVTLRAPSAGPGPRGSGAL
jgi:signal transduction histidine kinase